MAKILITGGTGSIGKELCRLFAEKGYDFAILSRNCENVNYPCFNWDPEKGIIDKAAFKGVETIIHLAGAPVGYKKWTREYKDEVLRSRADSARLLYNTCKELKINLNHYISASAIGWYPLKLSKHPFTEDLETGEGFLAEVCQVWEKTAEAFREVSEHVTIMRVGVVLDLKAGALPMIMIPVKYYFGAALGSGEQAVPWIHKTDVARMFIHAMEHNLDGVFNAVGPEGTDNEEFIQTIADVADKPILLPNAPVFIINMLFGERAEMLLKGAPISSKKIRATGFSYEFPTLNTALSDLFTSELS